MESLVYSDLWIGVSLISFLVAIAIVFWCGCVSASASISNHDKELSVVFGVVGFFVFVLIVYLTYLNGSLGRGTVYLEKDLTVGRVYEVLYSSETKVEGGYLVVIERRDQEGKKDQKKHWVCLLPIKPMTSFYITEVEGKIKYSDAAEMR